MKPQVLLIDDDEIFILLSTLMMRDNNLKFQPKTFGNGKTALDFLQNDYSTENKYLIFLDINMPVMNGWEFLEGIDKLILIDNVHVCIVSSSTDPDDMKKAENNKFVHHFFSKPLSKEALDEATALLSS